MKQNWVYQTAVRIVCKLIGHRYRATRVLSYGAMQVCCKTCGKLWAMHHDTKSFLPWDADFEALYSPGGALGDQPSQPHNTGDKPPAESRSA